MPDPTSRQSRRRMARLSGAAAAFAAIFAKIEVVGGENLQNGDRFIFAANHRSLFDMFVGLTTFRRLGVFPHILFGKKFLPGPLSWLAQYMGIIVVGKGGAIEAGVAALDAGGSLMVMPEGKLYHNPDKPKELGSIRPGAARMSRLSQVALAPVTVDGATEVWRFGSRLPRFPKLRNRRTVTVTIGSPMHPESDDDQAETERLMDVVRAQLTM